MAKKDKSLLDLETKIGKYNEKEQTLKNLRINKPEMNINLLKNNNFNKGNLLSFLDKFKKENEKIMNDVNKEKYNIENEQDNDEESSEGENNNNKIINLNENEENEENLKEKKKKNEEKIEIDLLMGILEQQKKKEINIEDIINNKNNNDDVNGNNNIEEGEKEIIDFLTKQK